MKKASFEQKAKKVLVRTTDDYPTEVLNEYKHELLLKCESAMISPRASICQHEVCLFVGNVINVFLVVRCQSSQ